MSYLGEGQKVVIEKLKDGLWNVSVGDKLADKLGYDEMLGLVASITIPDNRPCIAWLKNPEQRKAYEDYMNNLRKYNDDQIP